MNSTAFVAASPVVARSSAGIATTTFAQSRQMSVTAVPQGRARVVMSADDNDTSVPQGFTPFSENLNGRAAMMGFVLAIVTEAITGQGIVGQVGAIAKTFEVVSPF